MTRKVYRTAQGKIVDLGALMLQNENVRAVGNMKVNARGDLVDSNNIPIDTRNQQVSKQYNRQTTNPQNNVVHTSPSRTPAPGNKRKDTQPRSEPTLDMEIPKAPEDFDDNFVRESAPSETKSKDKQISSPDPITEPLPAGGLAAAIAKARQIKQEPLKTPRQIAQEKQGVKKL